MHMHINGLTPCIKQRDAKMRLFKGCLCSCSQKLVQTLPKNETKRYQPCKSAECEAYDHCGGTLLSKALSDVFLIL